MVIRIGKVKIDTQSRASRHRDYLWDQIYALRQEIIEIEYIFVLFRIIK